MTTEYTRSVTIACPTDWIDWANSFAAHLGPNPEGEMNTFKAPTYTKDGVDYAVTHTVIKPICLEPVQTQELPPNPLSGWPLNEMPVGYSKPEAKDVLINILGPKDILVAFDVDPHEQFAAWGLVRKEEPV